MNNIIDMKPRYFDERKEIQIFVEYLIDNDDTIHKTLAKEIGGVSGEPYDIVPNKY